MSKAKLWNEDYTVPDGWIIEFWDPDKQLLQARRLSDGVRDWGTGEFGWAWHRLRQSVAQRELTEAAKQ